MIVAAVSVLQCSMSDTQKRDIEIAPEAIEAIDFNELVGIGRAAKLTGRSTGQIGRDANEGRLLYVLDEKKQKRYTINDLDKRYGLRRPNETVPAEAVFELKSKAADTLETAVRQVRLEERVKALEEENRSLREDKERLWETTQQLTNRLLAAPPTASTSPAESNVPAASTPTPKSLLQRIFNL